MQGVIISGKGQGWYGGKTGAGEREKPCNERHVDDEEGEAVWVEKLGSSSLTLPSVATAGP